MRDQMHGETCSFEIAAYMAKVISTCMHSTFLCMLSIQASISATCRSEHTHSLQASPQRRLTLIGLPYVLQTSTADGCQLDSVHALLHTRGKVVHHIAGETFAV